MERAIVGEAVAAHKTAAKLKAQGENLTPQQAHQLDAAERTVARAQEANLTKKQEVIAQQGRDLHPTEARALADAQARLAKPETPPPPVKPSRPPMDVERSQQLIANVAKMPPQAQAHPQVQANLAQAQDAAARQPQPGQKSLPDKVPQQQPDLQTPSQAFDPAGRQGAAAPEVDGPAQAVSNADAAAKWTPSSSISTHRGLAPNRVASESLSPNADGENTPATPAHGPNGTGQAAALDTHNPGDTAGSAASPAPVAGKIQSSWRPSSHPPGSANRAAADKWHARLNSLRNMTNPVSVQEAVSWHPEHPVSADLQHKIFTATQTFLDMLPRDLVKDLGPFTMAVKSSLDEDANGEYDFRTDTLSLSYKHIESYTPTQLRGVMWHEMAHWLYFSALVNPRASKALKEWRAKNDAHWARRTVGELAVRHPKGGWTYIRDGLISDYAGRRYPGHDGGLEIPSVYLEQAALGPDILAKWCKAFPSEKETFDIVLSVFNK